jgi:PKD repeat protein
MFLRVPQQRNKFRRLVILSIFVASLLWLPVQPVMAGSLEAANTQVQPTSAPVITSAYVAQATVGTTYTYTVQASGTPPPTFQLTASPPGMTINSNTGAITWTPSVSGSYDVTVLATNSSGSASQSFIVRSTKAVNLDFCPAGVVGYWPLEEITGSKVFSDISGENHATCTGEGCPVVSNGLVGEAQYFDGNKRLAVPMSSDFSWGRTSSFSVELWASTKQLCTSNAVFIGKAPGDGSRSSWWLGCTTNGKAAFYLRDSDSNLKLISSDKSINDGNWHHILAGRDAVTGQNYLYVDGQLQRADTIEFTGGLTNPSPIGIGHYSGSYHFVGFLDEVAIYNRMLTQSEVQQHYQNGLGGTGYCATPTDPAAPMITSKEVTMAVINQPYIYNVRATGNPVPTFELTQKPAGMTINGTIGSINWIPEASGAYDVTVRAINSHGSDSQTFKITVTETAQAPTITSDPPTTVVAGQQYSYQVISTGNPAPVFSLKEEPSGMTIDVNTGLITWIPSEAGSYDVTVEASNIAGADSQSFVITVSEAEREPTITSTPIARAILLKPYSYQVEATGHPTPTLTLEVAPANMTFNPATGLISWLPEVTGDFEVTVRATNSAGVASQSFTILVDVPIWLPSIFKQ